MTTQQLNTAKAKHAAETMLGVAAGEEVGVGKLRNASLSDIGGEDPPTDEPKEPKEPNEEIAQKPVKGSGKGTTKGSGKGSGKVPDDRGPAPPLPKPLATFNL